MLKNELVLVEESLSGADIYVHAGNGEYRLRLLWKDSVGLESGRGFKSYADAETEALRLMAPQFFTKEAAARRVRWYIHKNPPQGWESKGALLESPAMKAS